MPPSRSDTRLLVGAAAAVVVGLGIVLMVVIWSLSRQADSPSEYEPFAAGPQRQLREQLRDGGPFYVPDPFGGRKSILFALESDNVVALMTHTPGDEDCRVRWRGRVDSFEDCNNNRLRSDQVGRYITTVERSEGQGGILFVDLRQELPPPVAGAPGN